MEGEPVRISLGCMPDPHRVRARLFNVTITNVPGIEDGLDELRALAARELEKPTTK